MEKTSSFKKAPLNTLRVLDPTKINPFVVQLPDHCNSPRLARNALVLGSSAALNRDPTSTSSAKNSSQTVPQLFHSNPQHLNLDAWFLGVDSSKNKASLWKWQRKLLPLRDCQQGPSTSQSGPYLRNGAEKIRWISPLTPCVKQVSDFLPSVPVPRSKQSPFNH